jgi:3-oxoacyl-[acyl-carrier protein] reductase
MASLTLWSTAPGVVGATSTPILDYASGEFERVLRVNLFGSFYMTKHALKPSLERRYGRILLLASIAGKEGNPGMAGYSVSNAGVIGSYQSSWQGVRRRGASPSTVLHLRSSRRR